jgi:hypothetical protein
MAENGSMKVIKKTTGGGMVFVTPETHKVLFKHCSGGHDAVHPVQFEKIIRPLLMIHGVKEIRMEVK